METILLPHLDRHPLHLCLFANVENAAFLRQQLLQGNTDFEYAFLDPSLLLSRRHVLAACFRAVNDSIAQRLKCRNVHAEIVFALSPNNNIAESFRRFGIQDESKNVIAIKVGGDPAQVEKHLLAHVQGQPTTLSDDVLASMHDVVRIRKVYRLEAPKKGAPPAQLGAEAEAFILGSMALKGS